MAAAPDGWKNRLFFGDDLKILREEIPSESAHLVYLDPPFNSNASYNVLFAETSGERSAAQIRAFEDTWHWSAAESEKAYHELATGGGKVGDLIPALRAFLGQSDIIATRPPATISNSSSIVFFHRIRFERRWSGKGVRPTATPSRAAGRTAAFTTLSFSIRRIRNDTFGTRSIRHTTRNISRPSTRHIGPGTGRRFQADNLTAAKPGGDVSYEWKGVQPYRGRYWSYSLANMEKFEAEGRLYYGKSGMPRYKRYLDEMPGVPLQDLWTDIKPASKNERLSYPTQKPEALLERILMTSSNEGDVVLDPFCGCGTAVIVAERLRRRWIGIDITHLAISLIKNRLATGFGEPELAGFEVIGDPKDLSSAKSLAEQDRFQFQFWALSLVNGQPLDDRRRGADRGVDGVIRFIDDKSRLPKRLLIQVKSDKVQVRDIRDLVGAMEREKAPIGAFATLEPPTRPMQQEAASAGLYEPEWFPGKLYPRVQILTIAQLLEGRQLEYPRVAPEYTFKAARKQNKSAGPGNGKLEF